VGVRVLMKLSIIFLSLLFLTSSYAESSLPKWEADLNHARELFELRKYKKAYEITAKILAESEDGTQQWVDSSYFTAFAALHAGKATEANKWFELHINAYGAGLQEGNIDDVYFLWIDNLIYGFAAYYQNTGDFKNSLKYHQARLNFFNSYTSTLKKHDWALAHNNISVSLSSLKRFDEARKHLAIAIDYAKSDPDTIKHLKFQKILVLASEKKCEEFEGEIDGGFAKSLNSLQQVVLKFSLLECKGESEKALLLANETLKKHSKSDVNKTIELLVLRQYVEKKL
jgi:tetratricopeptide (TPR) repeat protein